MTLSRDAERLGLILEREQSPHHLAVAAHVTEHDPDSERRLDLRVLGNFAARRGGTPLTIDSFARRRAVTLLKILLTNYGKVVLRDELIELLWPSDAPKDSAKLLKIAVHYLRRGLGESENGKTETSFISTEANGYAFNPASLHKLDALGVRGAGRGGPSLRAPGALARGVRCAAGGCGPLRRGLPRRRPL